MDKEQVQRQLLFPIQGRWFVILFLLQLIGLPGFFSVSELIVNHFPTAAKNDYLIGQIYYLYGATTTIILTLGCFAIYKVNWRSFFQPFSSKALIPALEITGFNLTLSIAAVYLVFLPLSYFAPEFVQFWLIDTPQLINFEDIEFMILANLISFISLVILAPLSEEVIFRGILLQRWGSKYNSHKGILLSSALFAALHSDPLGAFIFSLFMSYLVIRSNSLLLPIICHMAYNFVVWCWVLADYLYFGTTKYTLTMFQSEWYYAVFFSTLSGFWMIRVLPKVAPFRTWYLPRWF